MRSTTSRLLTVTGACATGATALAYRAYRKDLQAARKRIEDERQVINKVIDAMLTKKKMLEMLTNEEVVLR